MVSAQRPGRRPSVHPLTELRPGSPAASGWAAYLFGVVWALAGRDTRRRRRRSRPGLGGADRRRPVLVGRGGMRHGAGGLDSCPGSSCRPETLARIAQQAENDFVGVPCGLMDQMASTAAHAGHLLFFDIGRDVVEHIPFDPAASGLAVLVIDTRVHHSLADGEYAKRRASCEAGGRRTRHRLAARVGRRVTWTPRSPGCPTICCVAGSGTSSPRTTGYARLSCCSATSGWRRSVR